MGSVSEAVDWKREGEGGEIVPSVSLEALLARRDAAVACLTTIRKAVEELNVIGEAIGFGDSRGASKFAEPTAGGHYRQKYGMQDEKWLDYAKADVDAALWDHLMDKSGLRTFLDTKAREKWDKEIEANEIPPLTEENIRATFSAIHEQRGSFFERGVVELFRSLSWDYKSNRPQKFGTRLVVRYATGQRAGSTLDDLTRAFCVLDGKPEPDHRQGVWQALYKLEISGGTGEWSNDYFRIRLFKNQNGHVYPSRPDLVEQLNRILARHYPDALPAEAPR